MAIPPNDEHKYTNPLYDQKYKVKETKNPVMLLNEQQKLLKRQQKIEENKDTFNASLLKRSLLTVLGPEHSLKHSPSLDENYTSRSSFDPEGSLETVLTTPTTSVSKAKKQLVSMVMELAQDSENISTDQFNKMIEPIVDFLMNVKFKERSVMKTVDHKEFAEIEDAETVKKIFLVDVASELLFDIGGKKLLSSVLNRMLEKDLESLKKPHDTGDFKHNYELNLGDLRNHSPTRHLLWTVARNSFSNIISDKDLLELFIIDARTLKPAYNDMLGKRYDTNSLTYTNENRDYDELGLNTFERILSVLEGAKDSKDLILVKETMKVFYENLSDTDFSLHSGKIENYDQVTAFVSQFLFYLITPKIPSLGITAKEHHKLDEKQLQVISQVSKPMSRLAVMVVDDSYSDKPQVQKRARDLITRLVTVLTN